MFVPFVGTWLILGIVLLPVYMLLIGWFLGRPRNLRLSLVGLAYVAGLVVIVWSGLEGLSLVGRLFLGAD